MTNVIIRRPGPSRANGGVGQSDEQAISAATGWEYEHGETDEQINAIEGLIQEARTESGASHDNLGTCPDTGHCLLGSTFSWTVDADGDVILSAAFTKDEPGSVVNIRGTLLADAAWASHTWVIGTDGTVVGPREA